MGYIYSENIWSTEFVTVYPCRYFDPIAPGDTLNLMSNDTVSIHHYAASWAGSKTRLKRKFISIIGNEKIKIIRDCLKGSNIGESIK